MKDLDRVFKAFLIDITDEKYVKNVIGTLCQEWVPNIYLKKLILEI